MNKLITVFIVLLFAGCSAKSPQTLKPPPSTHSEMAQISVKREFRLVGGGNTQYIYGLFDTGTGIEYNAYVPESGKSTKDILVYVHRISLDSFEQAVLRKSARISFDSIQRFHSYYKSPSLKSATDQFGLVLPYFIGPLEHTIPVLGQDRVVETIDNSLLDATLVMNIRNPNAYPDVIPKKLNHGDHGKLERVKIRLLYDEREGVLNRKVEISSNEPCYLNPYTGLGHTDPEKRDGKGETRYARPAPFPGLGLRDPEAPRHVDPFWFRGQNPKEARLDNFVRALTSLAPEIKSRPGDYLYRELCALRAPFEPSWNERYVGWLRGFTQGTWYRPPGRMALSAKLGWSRVYANEIRVEAGKQ